MTDWDDAAKDPDTTRVFLSYSRQDSAFVEALRTQLTDRGYDVWIDRKDIRGGEEWRKRIATLILNAHVVVFVLTDAWLGSEVCAWEIETAAALGKRLIPLAHGPRKIEPDKTIGKLNFIFSDQPSGGATTPDRLSEAAFAALCAAIDLDIVWVRAYAELVARAEEWRPLRSNDRLLPESLLDGAIAILHAAPAAAKESPIAIVVRDFVARSEHYTHQQRAQRIAREADVELQRGRPTEALERIGSFCASRNEDVFALAPELSAVTARALSSIGLPFEGHARNADPGNRLGILNGAGLIVTAQDGTLSLRSALDFSLVDLVTFDLPIAALDVDDATENVLLTFADGTVSIWSARTKQWGAHIIDAPQATQIAKFTAHGQSVLTFAVVHHGCVWDAATGRSLWRQKAGFTAFQDAFVDETHQRILILSLAGDLRQWRFGQERELARDPDSPETHISKWLPDQSNADLIARARFDASGRYLFVEGKPPEDGYSDWNDAQRPRSLYRLNPGQKRHSFALAYHLPPHRAANRPIAFSANGDFLALQDPDKSLSVRRSANGDIVDKAPAGVDYAQLAVGDSGDLLIALTQTGSVDVWRRQNGRFEPMTLGALNVATGRRQVIRQRIALRQGGVTSLAFSQNGGALAAAFRDGSVGVMTLNGEGQSFGPEQAVVSTHVARSPDDDALLVCFGDGQCGILAAKAGVWRFKVRCGQSALWGGAWLDNEHAVVISGQGVAHILDAASGRRVAWRDLNASHLLGLCVLAEDRFAVSGAQGQIVVLALQDDRLREVQRLRIGDKAVTALGAFPDHVRIAAACADGALIVADLSGQSKPTRFELLHHALTSVDVSKDGALIAVASKGGEAMVLSARTARVLLWHADSDRPIWSAKFSPDGTALALALEQGTITFLDVRHLPAFDRDYRSAMASFGAAPIGAASRETSPLHRQSRFYASGRSRNPAPPTTDERPGKVLHPSARRKRRPFALLLAFGLIALAILVWGVGHSLEVKDIFESAVQRVQRH